MNNFIVSMQRNDCLAACKNFQLFSKRRIHKDRVDAVHRLLAPREPIFFGLIKRKPICTTVREAIKHLKQTPTVYGHNLWAQIGRPSQNMILVDKLLKSIESNYVGKEVLLDSSLCLLTKYVDY